jgi:hypothetical protein
MTRKYTIRDPNYHKKHSDAAKKRSTPEYRKLQSIRSKKAQSNPVYKKMRSITAKERCSDPLIRKQMSERAKNINLLELKKELIQIIKENCIEKVILTGKVGYHLNHIVLCGQKN